MHSKAIATVSSGLAELSLAPGSIKSHKQSDLNFCPFCADVRFPLPSHRQGQGSAGGCPSRRCLQIPAVLLTLLQEGAFPNLIHASLNMYMEGEGEGVMGWLLSSVTYISPFSSFSTQILLMSYGDKTHPQPALCKSSAGMYGLHSPLSFKCDQGTPKPKSHQLLGRFQAPEMLLNASLGAFQSIFDSHSFCRQTVTYETTQLKKTDDNSTTAPNSSYWAVTPLRQLLPAPNIYEM